MSAIPIVKGEGPLDTPIMTEAVRNSKLLTLSALEMLLCDVNVRDGSDLREGGRGIDIYPYEEDVGVGVCRTGCCLEDDCDSLSSLNKSLISKMNNSNNS